MGVAGGASGIEVPRRHFQRAGKVGIVKSAPLRQKTNAVDVAVKDTVDRLPHLLLRRSTR